MPSGACPGCGSLLPQNAGSTCAGCLALPPRFDEMRAAFVYGGPVRDAILALKHSGRMETGVRLGRLAAQFLKLPSDVTDSAPLDPLVRRPASIVVPVPLHPRRLAERGYNQALLLARGMASAWGLPVRTGVLHRIRNTGSHQGRTALERRAALAGAFEVSPGTLAPRVRVVLVDDVTASRSTAQECARVLKSAGADAVLVRVVAASMV